jgi:hypothetical protein
MPGGSIVPRYVLQLVFSEKSHHCLKLNNHQMSKSSETVSADLESLEFYKNFDVCLTKFKNNLIVLNKISHSFLLTTNLFTG